MPDDRAAQDDTPDAAGAGWRLYFGGPDRAPRRLRDLLAHLVDAQPPGARIDWATYYFRDRDLAHRLVAAAQRGVDVRLAVEPHPRRAGANDAALALLRAGGLGAGRLYTPKGPLGGHLHTKIYAFSHPAPVALIGSFNPSGDTPEDADTVAEIGDQDRGHNLLLALDEPALARGLAAHATGLGRGARWAARLAPRRNRVLRGAAGEIYFYPRLDTGLVARALGRLPQGAELKGAISHLKAAGLGGALVRLARRGVRLQLLVHDTERRVPQALVDRLQAAGARVLRYRHPERLPMHAKFILTRSGDARRAWLGSFNHNAKSAWLNDEVLMCARDPALCAALDARFDAIAAEAALLAAGGGQA